MESSTDEEAPSTSFQKARLAMAEAITSPRRQASHDRDTRQQSSRDAPRPFPERSVAQ